MSEGTSKMLGNSINGKNTTIYCRNKGSGWKGGSRSEYIHGSMTLKGVPNISLKFDLFNLSE